MFWQWKFLRSYGQMIVISFITQAKFLADYSANVTSFILPHCLDAGESVNSQILIKLWDPIRGSFLKHAHLAPTGAIKYFKL